jgi:hypothetical protein
MEIAEEIVEDELSKLEEQQLEGELVSYNQFLSRGSGSDSELSVLASSLFNSMEGIEIGGGEVIQGVDSEVTQGGDSKVIHGVDGNITGSTSEVIRVTGYGRKYGKKGS